MSTRKRKTGVSEARSEDPMSEFDGFEAGIDEFNDGSGYERVVFGEADGGAAFYSSRTSGGGLPKTVSARRKARTVNTDGPEVFSLPDEAPEGWAEP